jgi:Uncharacterized protein conserved in bacteria
MYFYKNSINNLKYFAIKLSNINFTRINLKNMKHIIYLLALSALLCCSSPHDTITVNGTKYQVVEGDLNKGIANCYFETGTLKSTVEINDGTLNGKYVEYYDNNKLKKSCLFKNGQYDGPYKIYFSNGKLFEEGTYKEGYHDKKTIRYNIDGSKVSEAMYSNGDMISLTEFIKGNPVKYQLNIKVDNDYINSISTYHFSVTPKPYMAQYNIIRDNKPLFIQGNSFRVRRQAGERFTFTAKGITQNGIPFMLTSKK